jgi:hypothetical protein
MGEQYYNIQNTQCSMGKEYDKVKWEELIEHFPFDTIELCELTFLCCICAKRSEQTNVL